MLFSSSAWQDWWWAPKIWAAIQSWEYITGLTVALSTYLFMLPKGAVWVCFGFEWTFLICYRLDVCGPLKFTWWSPNPQCDGIRRWDLWKVVRLDEVTWVVPSVFLNEIGALVRVMRELVLYVFLLCEDTRRSWQSVTCPRVLNRTCPCWPWTGPTLVVDFHPLKSWEMNFYWLWAIQSIVVCFSSLN